MFMLRTILVISGDKSQRILKSFKIFLNVSGKIGKTLFLFSFEDVSSPMKFTKSSKMLSRSPREARSPNFSRMLLNQQTADCAQIQTIEETRDPKSLLQICKHNRTFQTPATGGRACHTQKKIKAKQQTQANSRKRGRSKRERKRERESTRKKQR